MDGDGLFDLLVTNSQSGSVELWRGDGDGSFGDTPQEMIRLPGPTGKQGTEYAQNDGFVVLADGTIAHFRLSAFDASSLVNRIFIGKSEVSANIRELTLR